VEGVGELVAAILHGAVFELARNDGWHAPASVHAPIFDATAPTLWQMNVGDQATIKSLWHV